MGYYSDDRNSYKRQSRSVNHYISPGYGEIKPSDPYAGRSRNSEYYSANPAGYDSDFEEDFQEQPRRRTRKKIRVPSVYIGGIKFKLPSLQVFLLLAAGITAVLLKYRILIYGIGALSFFSFLNMSGARHRRLIVPQRVLCVVITAVLLVMGVFDIGPGLPPSGGGNISLQGNVDNQLPIVITEPPAVATQPAVIIVEPEEIVTLPPPTKPKPKRLSHDGIDLDMPLFYNENGGKYYHTSDMCPSVGESYLPLTGTLIYEQLSVGKYKTLKRCTTCSAPVRPHTH